MHHATHGMSHHGPLDRRERQADAQVGRTATLRQRSRLSTSSGPPSHGKSPVRSASLAGLFVAVLSATLATSPACLPDRVGSAGPFALRWSGKPLWPHYDHAGSKSMTRMMAMVLPLFCVPSVVMPLAHVQTSPFFTVNFLAFCTTSSSPSVR